MYARTHARTWHHTNTVMSEWFDLLNFESPRRHGEGGARRHRSASPSPRGRVSWQPSSSPLDADKTSGAEKRDATKDLPLPTPSVEDEHENRPPQISPSRVRTMRARRNARRAHAHGPYTYAMYAYALPGHSTAQSRDAPTSRTSPLPSPRFARVHSDPVTVPAVSQDTHDKPESDDSFTRLMGEDELDAAAVEEIASRQGW